MNSLFQLLASKTFQVFLMVIMGVGALTSLMATGTITTSQGLDPLFAIIGFGIGVPVTVGSSSNVP